MMLKSTTKFTCALIALCSLAWTIPSTVCQISTANFLPFGLNANDSMVPTIDDGSSQEIIFNTDFVFFGRRETSVYVNTNGVLSFGSTYTDAGPQTFPTISSPLIAPFYHDVDVTRAGAIYYRQTSDPMDIASVVTTLQNLPVFLTFTPTLLFIATWDRVAPFRSVGLTSDRNTFQVILATDNQTSVAIFVYGDIQWGERAEIGFNAGDGVSFLTVPSSGSSATLDIETQSNVGVPGLFAYQVDDLQTSQPPNTTATPSTEPPFVIPAHFLLFGLNVSDSVVPLVDDGSSQEIRLNTSFVFYGRRESMLYVNTNGVLSFGSTYTDAGPQTFPTNSSPLIAPFYHDVDVTSGGAIYYRQTSDPMDIASVATTLQNLPVFLTFTPTLLFIATWDRVAPFRSVGLPSDRNTFQVILATDGQISTVIFNYGDIQWGERAEIGFNAGDGVGFLTVPSSGSNATLDIETQSNVGVPGQFFYRVDDLEFAIECGLLSTSSSGPIQVTCTTEGLEAESVICNYDNGEVVEACDLETTIDFSRFDPGPHTLVITVTSTDGQTASFDPISFNVPERLILNFINDTPRIQGNNITADFEVSGPAAVQSVRCALTGFPYQDCSSGSVTFSNIPLRDSNNRQYILRVAATTVGGIKMVIRRPVQPEQQGFCNAQFINGGVLVSGSTAIVEFSPVGPFETFLCSLDRGELQPCSSPQEFGGLSIGPHRLKVVPFIEECGRSRYPAHIRFTVQPE